MGDGGLAVAVGSTRRGKRIVVDRNEKKGAGKLGVVFLFCVEVYGNLIMCGKNIMEATYNVG